VDLARLLAASTPIVRARYEFEEAGEPTLAGFVDRWLAGATASQRGEAAPVGPAATAR
jgi:predicted GTPase